MVEVHVARDFAAPPERVFDVLSDHERLFGTREMRARVVRPGASERNGLGAQREVRAGAVRFLEDITRFDRPRGYDYRIVRLEHGPIRIPIDHERGWIELAAVAGGTRVDWRTRFEVRVPLLGALLERRFAAAIRRAFEALLDHAQTLA